MEAIVGGWDTVEVAKAQLDLVIRELMTPERTPPYVEFLKAMAAIGLQEGDLLDVGCGVGHYGVLCEKYYPRIDYYGSDVSQAMIDQAKLLAPLGHYNASPLKFTDFDDFDIVLLSQVMEMTDDPPFALVTVLDTAPRYVILNRIRLTSSPSHAIEEHTYCGNAGRNWLWNMAEIKSIIDGYGKIVHESVWDNGNQATFVVEVNGD